MLLLPTEKWKDSCLVSVVSRQAFCRSSTWEHQIFTVHLLYLREYFSKPGLGRNREYLLMLILNNVSLYYKIFLSLIISLNNYLSIPVLFPFFFPPLKLFVSYSAEQPPICVEAKDHGFHVTGLLMGCRVLRHSCFCILGDKEFVKPEKSCMHYVYSVSVPNYLGLKKLSQSI